MTICPPRTCTGCAACANACPAQCITLTEDAYGELHPVINETVCIHCRICIETCPNNASPIFCEPKACFAAWNTNAIQRARCASGGLATLLAEYVILYKHGIVFGTAYDSEMTPRTLPAESLARLEAFKGSKYVQSIISRDTFQNVKELLKKGRFVLYIGTPCQVAGLKLYLQDNWQNLITVDLICHGVCPSKYFEEEIAHLRRKYHIKTLLDVRFRGNDGNNYCMTFWEEKRGKRICRYRGGSFDYYLKAFLMGISLRENCHQCPYARRERISDITIGDFIGLGSTTPFPHLVDNVSSITLNTELAVDFYADFSVKTPTLMNVQRKYEERLAYRPSLLEPFPQHPLSKKFRGLYRQMGFSKAIRKTLTIPLLNAWFHRQLLCVFDQLSAPIQNALRSAWHLVRK